METNDNGISLFEQEEEKKQGRRRAFVLGAVVVLGVTAALGIGAMIGSKASDGSEERRAGVDRPLGSQQAVEPTAVVDAAGAADETADEPAETGEVLGGSDAPQGNTGDEGDGGVVEPPATETPVPATETPVPEDTPTDTPTATPTTEPDCEFCIDPVILGLIDLTPPQFLSGGRAHCPEGTIVAVTLDEEADVWVEYIKWGIALQSDVEEDTTFGYFNLGGGPIIFPAMSIEVHAMDAWGNESTLEPPLKDCP
jgi:hypothetical protein